MSVAALIRVPRIALLLRRWRFACLWAAGLTLYSVAILLVHERAALWLNNISWLIASGCAAAACLHAVRRVEIARRRSWLVLGLACVSWFIGELHWAYGQLVLGSSFPFPSIGQLFFSGFPILAITAVLNQPETRHRAAFTVEQAGNLGLIICCLAMTLVLGMLEPALQIEAPATNLWLGFAYTMLVATTPLTTLYALWSYHWSATWTPMALLVVGTAAYAISDLIVFRSVLTGGYFPGHWVNAGWLVMFGCIAAAAHEQSWVSTHRIDERPILMQKREQWLQAVVPALLIIVMIAVGVSSAGTLTLRAVNWSAALFVLFALILAVRETYILRQSQRLTLELFSANEQYRDLNAALEHRVNERTVQLKHAYDEMESFSYAVAHDLKAPLRAINSFSRLLEREMQGQASARAGEYFDRICNGSMRMSILIDDLLAYSQVEGSDAQRTTVELGSAVDAAVKHYSDDMQRRKVALSVEVQPILVSVNEKAFLLALRNLIENAVKYTRDSPHPRIEIRAGRNDSGLQLSVEDNGIGFDMAHHEQIFTIFKRLHRDDEYPGTGIGLALVRKAIERMGGRVWAESTPGAGATFHIELPKEVAASRW